MTDRGRLRSGMMLNAMDIASYEGLVYSTAARYAPLLDDDLDDVRQALRMKVWKAIERFDQTRVTGKFRGMSRPDQEDAVRRWVYSCVKNQVKDLLKSQDRHNTKRGGALLTIEDLTADGGHFEVTYLSASDEQVYAVVEDEPVELPSTLTELERTVVGLLLLDFSQAEIARQLTIHRKLVAAAQRSIEVKMSDWRPSSDGVVERLPIAA